MLSIENLNVYYETEEGDVHAVDGVNLELERNETIGLVGESGCGKTTTAKSIIRLLATNGRIADGTIEFEGTDITELSDRQLRKQIRWNEVSMIPQNAMNGFDPVYTVGEQIVEVIRAHESKTSKNEAWERARDLFDRLGIESDRVTDYPHQFSGGMAQRAMVALALALSPSIVLADEPTTALDVVIQDRILRVIKDLQDELNSSMILITHDMSVVSETCDDIAVMYGGRIVEYADAETVIKEPRHPYTLGLRNSFPDITQDSQELISIPGVPPDLVDPDEGCKFAPRCPFAEDQCWEETPQPEEYGENHIVECHRADEVEHLQEEAKKRETWMAMKDDPNAAPTKDVKDVKDVNQPADTLQEGSHDD
ncbi:ABC transporter ATP-binding protein [Halobacteria archaeon AArc-curdl1]|uniref:ABC transporter ATP-binding protein n=1 Tax=Natronosalvus hydrolyticus TaxID=2979988 RepID=A0AAP3E5D5_9EURY|nr:ABC transporter ATP-binding protein [Halobacteria archaeon AArc-curdl1]